MTSLSEARLDWDGAIGASLSGAPILLSPEQAVSASKPSAGRPGTKKWSDGHRFAMRGHCCRLCGAAARTSASAEARRARRTGAAATCGGSDGLWLHRQEALALQPLARKLAGPADRFRLFPCLSFRGFFVVAAELHLAENTLALHLLFQRLEGLVDVIVANENLHASSFSVRSVSALGKWDRGGAGSSAHATSGRCLPEWPMKVHQVAKARSSIGKKARHVPHLPAGAHGDLAVKVNGGARNGEPFSIVIDLMADQIGHFDPAFTYRFGERPAGHSPNVLL